MKNFFVTEIADGDDKIKGTSVYSFDTLNEAEASYHSKLGTAMKSDLYTSESIYVTEVTNDGIVFHYNLSKHFTR